MSGDTHKPPVPPTQAGKPGEAGSPPRPDEAGKQVATVTTQVLLTGAAARVMAAPTSIQSLESIEANGILPWGPVQAIHTVTLGGQQWIVNQLSSPDPFTATYQMDDGSIIATNRSLEDVVLGPPNEETEPPRVQWTSILGDTWEVVPGRMIVYFAAEATESDISTFLDAHDIEVVFSWFEPPDGEGMNSAVGGGSGGVTKQTSEMESLTLGEEGNAIAWFQLEYPQSAFPTVDMAYLFFCSQPLVGSAVPQITDAVYCNYAAPNDPYYQSGNSRWIDAYDLAGYGEIPLQPYLAGPQQIIAVVDDGVYRNQYDPMRLTWMGIDCYDTDIVYGSGEPGQPAGVWGNPRYKTTNPRFEWPNGPSPNYYWHRYQGHGTQVCSLINSITNNGKGIPSFAPGAYVMPIGLNKTTRYYGAPGVKDEPTFTLESVAKAARALRFTFPHGNNTFYIRVVNLSLGWNKSAEDLYNWLHPGEPGKPYRPSWNINRDILKGGDRLYVASAGNEGRNAPVYPAAYEAVLGVTGWQFDPTGGTPTDRYLVQPDSNYMYDDSYPVSGIYNIGFDDGETVYNWGWTSITPLDHPNYSYSTQAQEFREFSGTSAAAPQISALAYHLYSRKPYLGGANSTTYLEMTAYLSDPAWHIQGLEFVTTRYEAPVSFRRAIDNWGGL